MIIDDLKINFIKDKNGDYTLGQLELIKIFGREMNLVDIDHQLIEVKDTEYQFHPLGWHVDKVNYEDRIAIYYKQKSGIIGGNLLVDRVNFYRGDNPLPEIDQPPDPQDIELIEVIPDRCVIFSPHLLHCVEPWKQENSEIIGIREVFVISACYKK